VEGGYVHGYVSNLPAPVYSRFVTPLAGTPPSRRTPDPVTCGGFAVQAGRHLILADDRRHHRHRPRPSRDPHGHRSGLQSQESGVIDKITPACR